MHLVLDLDETLVSVSVQRSNSYDFKFTLNETTYYGKKRPGLDLFLKFAFKNFDTVSVWTAATKEYADIIIRFIMTNGQINSLLFLKSRNDLAIGPDGGYFKPLKNIYMCSRAKSNEMDETTTIMIDDKEEVLVANPGNCIVIPPWKGSANDKYLFKLLIVLDGIGKTNITFGHFKKVFKLCNIVDDISDTEDDSMA